MILHYFKKKENKYKIIADQVYIDIINNSKTLIKINFFDQANFDSSFELISIILVFYFKKYKESKNQILAKKINEELIKNFINDLDKSMREIGIGDMSIGKHVKKYVKKFYYRLKLIDNIFLDYDEDNFVNYLNSLKSTNSEYSKQMALNLYKLYNEIKLIN